MWSTQRIEFNKDKPNCAKLCAFSPLLNGCWGFPASWKEDLDNTAKRSGNRMDQNHIHRWIAGHVCKDADVDHSKGSTNGLSGETPLIYISLFVMLQKTLPEKATFWMVHGKWILQSPGGQRGIGESRGSCGSQGMKLTMSIIRQGPGSRMCTNYWPFNTIEDPRHPRVSAFLNGFAVCFCFLFPVWDLQSCGFRTHRRLGKGRKLRPAASEWKNCGSCYLIWHRPSGRFLSRLQRWAGSGQFQHESPGPLRENLNRLQ